MTLTYDIANWMSLVDDSKSLSELSIPGTHDSAAMKRGNFDDERLITQTRTVKEQLEAGVRFLDLRCNYNNNKFELYHEISVNLGFSEVRDVCRQFLQDHPRETIIASIKSEGTPSGNDPQVSFQKRFQKYVDETPGLWYLQNAIPALGRVRGKIVLFRRFALDDTTSLGINAFDGFPNDETKTIPGPPKLTIQDWYSLVSGRLTKTLLNEKWEVVEKLLDESSSLRERDTLYVNFTSAAGYSLSSRYPRPVAQFINPRLASKLTSNLQGRFGIIPRDFEADFTDVDVNRVIAHSNVPYEVFHQVYLESKRDGYVIDAEGFSPNNRTPIIAYPRKTPAAANQLWFFVVSDTPPDFFIVSAQGAIVIDIDREDPTPGTRLIGFSRKTPDARNQLWRLVPSDETERYFFITSRLNGGVITVDGFTRPEGTPLATRPRKTSDNDDQLWSFVKHD